MANIYVRYAADGVTILETFGVDQPGMGLKLKDDQEASVAVFLKDPMSGGSIKVTAQDVGDERDRRLTLGFNYAFGDARGIHRFATTERDRKGWDQVTRLKDTLIQVGDASPIKIWTETGEVEVTPAEWNMIILYAATAFEQPLWAASAALQKKTKIPADFRDDKYWPPV